jgi:hypothetical protein
LRSAKVEVHELIAWGIDEYPYRCSARGSNQEEIAKRVEQSQQRLVTRECHVNNPALLEVDTDNILHLLADHAQRADLQEEYQGLNWMLGVVDLRRLLAFQRRLVFSDTQRLLSVPKEDDWSSLVSLAFGQRRSTKHYLVHKEDAAEALNISLHSDNPDLQLRLKPRAGQCACLPLSLHGGSPFFEVAELRGRWFLRDGYHRAYRLLQAGVHRVPAVVIHTRTVEELGAAGPWFFDEEQMYSDHPPRVVDFLDKDLVLRYERVALRKVIRICIEESLEPFDETEEIQGGNT